MKVFHIRLFVSIIIICSVSYGCSFKDIPKLEEPIIEYSNTYIDKFAYSLSYNEDIEQANWIAYRLESYELEPKFKRTNRFYTDTLILSGTAENNDYLHSGYDRGHLAPAADMVWSEQAMSESFSYCNISPQYPAFNRGIWKKLEVQVRKWVLQYGDVYITTGPIWSDKSKSIGFNKVVVPTHFFKALLFHDQNNSQCIGFIFPNEKCDGNLSSYAVSIDSLESVILLDLFHKLPNTIEDTVEMNFYKLFWFDDAE
jgi:endonuclease G